MKPATVFVVADSEAVVSIKTMGEGRVLRLALAKDQIVKVKGRIEYVSVESGSARVYDFLDETVTHELEEIQLTAPVGSMAQLLQSIDAKVATEATLQSILSQLDVTLSTRASEATLSAIASNIDVALSTRASEATLQAIASNTSTPSTINSALVTIDNSAGTADLVQALFATSTPARKAVIKVRSLANVSAVYVGSAAAQELSMSVGDSLSLEIDDLSKVYVRVPAGGVAELEVLWVS